MMMLMMMMMMMMMAVMMMMFLYISIYWLLGYHYYHSLVEIHASAKAKITQSEQSVSKDYWGCAYGGGGGFNNTLYADII